MSARVPAALPAKLSSLSTTTLTQILELTRSHQLNLKAPDSLTYNIRKNLTSLKQGLEQLEDEQARDLSGSEDWQSRDQILAGLKKQFVRLVDLVKGLGVDTEGFERQARQSEPLIDDDGGGVPLDDLSSVGAKRDDETPLIPAVSIQIDEDDPATDLRRDEEEMQRANRDVLQLQHQMIRDQDDTLDALSLAISRQRDLSVTISSELELHQSLLEETDQAVDNTDSRLRRASRGLDRVSKKARQNYATCTILGLIILLLVLIIILK